ncbi:hypothetical protein [Sediminispirochaeta bajacaliforniensis]|uniref:hypothetical protein n=1 Tax=Sediminispirochaeta bajacaliforniensis TaxID=148 RepID=UPI001FE1994B|nr:hypothetical protein [Sediminispirochaeta bajacaliforniensis]
MEKKVSCISLLLFAAMSGLPLRGETSQVVRLNDKGVLVRNDFSSSLMRGGVLLSKPEDKQSDINFDWWFVSPLLFIGRMKPAGTLSLLRAPLAQGADSDHFSEPYSLIQNSSLSPGGHYGAILFPFQAVSLLYFNDEKRITLGLEQRIKVNAPGNAQILFHPQCFLLRSLASESALGQASWFVEPVPFPGSFWQIAGTEMVSSWQGSSSSSTSIELGMELWNASTPTSDRGWYGRGRSRIRAKSWSCSSFFGCRSSRFIDAKGDLLPAFSVFAVDATLGKERILSLEGRFRRKQARSPIQGGEVVPMKIERAIGLKKQWEAITTSCSLTENVSVDSFGSWKQNTELKTSIDSEEIALDRFIFSCDSELSATWIRETKEQRIVKNEEGQATFEMEVSRNDVSLSTQLRQDYSSIDGFDALLWRFTIMLPLAGGTASFRFDGGEKKSWRLEWRYSL